VSKTRGDRAAEGTLTRGALGIHVDPLVVTRAVGELINACLVERRPRGSADLFPDVLRRSPTGMMLSTIASHPCVTTTVRGSYQVAVRLS